MLCSVLNSFNAWKQNEEITYRQVFQCQLIVHPQEHKRYNKTYEENNERHLSTIFRFVGFLLKVLRWRCCNFLLVFQSLHRKLIHLLNRNQHIFWTATDHHHSAWHLFFNWDLLPVRLNRHYEAWSYKKTNYRKLKVYRKSVQKEPTVKRCLLILDLKQLRS